MSLVFEILNEQHKSSLQKNMCCEKRIIQIWQIYNTDALIFYRFKVINKYLKITQMNCETEQRCLYQEKTFQVLLVYNPKKS